MKSTTFKYLVVNLGCRLNQAELTRAEEFFQMTGGSFDSQKPDLVVINTCAVTSRAEQQSRQTIRRLKCQYPDSIIVAWGCAVEKWQTMGFKGSSLGIKFLFGNQNKDLHPAEFVKLVSTKAGRRPGQKKSFFLSRPRRFIKIQDGCNKFCSYCLIAYLRHRSTSRPVSEIVQEINRAVKDGVKEVILTGVDIADYRSGRSNLADLLETVLNKTSIGRIRLGSIGPEAFADQRLISLISQNKRLLPHFHISLQSGSNRILKLMKRVYTADEYLNWVGRLQNLVDNILISTDVIVGFPSESQTDFLATAELVKKIKFSRLHIFPFSKRPGTLVGKLNLRPVPIEEIKTRSRHLKQVNQTNQIYWRNYFKTKELEVLWESYSNGWLKGWTENYLPAQRPGEAKLVGKVEKCFYSRCLPKTS